MQQQQKKKTKIPTATIRINQKGRERQMKAKPLFLFVLWVGRPMQFTARLTHSLTHPPQLPLLASEKKMQGDSPPFLQCVLQVQCSAFVFAIYRLCVAGRMASAETVAVRARAEGEGENGVCF